MRSKESLALILSASMFFVAVPGGFARQADQPASPSRAPAAMQRPEQLQQLVAPIALYPDALVAQILAAATYPTQVVVADRWIQQHPELMQCHPAAR
jgi:Protein of unknown function (DUF3300)